jgi:hypothetical protein
MSRAVSVNIQTGLDAAITVPIYLVEIELVAPLYFTTGAQVSWGGQTWDPVGMSVDRVAENGAKVTVRNDDNSGAALILNNALRDTSFKIYIYYNGDAEEIFRGYGGAATMRATTATITLHSDRAANTRAPRQRIAGPVFTHLPKPGEIIQWGDGSLKVSK